MCKCSFVRVASLALLLMVAAVAAQEYDVEEPSNGDVVFNRVRSADVALIFDEKEIVVNPGEQLDLACGVQGNYRYCIWETGPTIYQVEDVYEAVYPGFSKPAVTEGNECGVVITSANIEHHGSWTCKVFAKGSSLVATKNVIVTIKPTSPLLEVDTSRGVLEVSNEEESDVKCSVAAARPAVGIRWFLGDRDITVFADSEETPTDEGGIYKSVSTLRRTFEPKENGQLLACSISHQTLAVTENASIPISVIFKPMEKALSTYYQIVPGNDYEVKFNFTANPVPTRTEWRYGESFQNMAVSIPVPGMDDRYTTNIEDLGDGLYTATLRITGFTESDANQRYLLVVENRLGETQYQVKLSVDEAPIDTLSGGAVVGIVIVVLIVVLAVIAAGYARYRQMFCFASRAESKAYIQDPERNETDNGTANDAVKNSTDHVNGKTDTTVANGNGNLEQTQVEEINTEKKNTDV